MANGQYFPTVLITLYPLNMLKDGTCVKWAVGVGVSDCVTKMLFFVSQLNYSCSL